MRLLIALVITLSLTNCAALKTLQNPLTQNQLQTVEEGYGIALSAAKGYRQACIDHVASVYPTCRTVVPQLQDAIRKVEGARAAAQNFVKNNPNVSPASFVTAIVQAVSDFQAVEAKYGVK